MAQQKKSETKTNGDNSDNDSDDNTPSHPAAGFRLYGDYDEGDIVKLQGLIKKSEWNDQFAKIVKYVPDKQRYHILTTLHRSDEQLKSALLREDNLKIIYSLKQNTLKKKCIVCLKIIEISQASECQFCRSMFYCSNKCKKQHFTQKGHLRFMCNQYKILAQYEYKMISKTRKLFEFNNLVREEMDIWLQKYGLLNKSIWKRLWHNQKEGFTPYGELLERFGLNKKSNYAFWAFGSKKDMVKQRTEHGERYIPIFDDVDGKYCVKKCKVLKNWKSYYKLKQLTLKSPVSHFMGYVMTIYYGLTSYLKLEPNLDDTIKEVNIHLIGAEIELDIKHLFCELLCLLPGYNINIFMFAFGANISDKLKQETLYKIPSSENKLRIIMYKKEYTKANVKELLDAKYRIPDILFGLNAGFEGFPAHWANALKYIYKKGIPSIFTEYTITTVQSAEVHMKDVLGGNRKMDEKYKMNPWRSSIITFNPVSRFSSIQNAWIYTLFTNKLKAK